MKRKSSVCSIVLLLLTSILAPALEVGAQRRRPPVRRNFPPAGPNAYLTSRFNQIADEYLKGYYSFNPTEATAAGLHEYDMKLETRSSEAVAREIRRLRDTILMLNQINPSALTDEARLDYLVLLSHARSQLLELQDIRMWRRDPNVYNHLTSASIDNILKRNYAPIEQRLTSVMAREHEIERLLSEARANLDSPPRIYTEMAISQVKGSLDYFSRVVPQMIERAGGQRLNAARKSEFEASNNSVIKALQSFNEWLGRELLPRSNGNFSIGEENFRRKLLYDEMVETPIAQLVAEGERELRRTQEAMRLLAEEIAPGRGIQFALRSLGRDHPTAEGLVGDTRAELDRIRAFVRTNNIMTPPASENLRVAETPEYDRSNSFASMDSPGAFERVATEAYFYVTPPDAQWDERRREEHLSFYNRYALPIIVMHEVYPGHYYQYLDLKRSPSRVRTALSSNSFVEGWAHYCEQMMLDEGFGGNNPKLRMAQLNLALLRLCRYLVGLKMHTQGMSYEQGVDFFMREGYQERVNAEREARRGTVDPTYLVYTLGKMQILHLREEYRARMGASFKLGEFHDRLLSYGMPPLKIIRLAMLGDQSSNVTLPDNTPDQAKTLDFSVLAIGATNFNEKGDSLEYVATQIDWERVWHTLGNSGFPPNVNFTTRAVLIASQGESPSTSSGISIDRLQYDGKTLTVRMNTKRGNETAQNTKATFIAVSIPRLRDDVEMKFEDEVKKLEQNRNVNERSLPIYRRYGRRRRG